MAIPKLVIDSGNHQVKALCGASKVDFLHLLAPITKTQFDDGLKRFKERAQDYICVDLPIYEKDGTVRGTAPHYFVVGESALRHNVTRRQGATRYEREYYGPLFASAVSRLSANLGQRNTKGVFSELKREGLRVIASHASRDHLYADQLKEAINGNWEFRCGNDEFSFKAEVVDVYEEPFGGYAKRAFVKNEHGRWVHPLKKDRVGMIDIGGGTVGVLVINEGVVDYGSAGSGGQGVNSAVDRLKDILKAAHPKVFMQAQDIPLQVLHEAIKTRVYRGKGTKMHVSDEVDEALYPLFNEVKNLWAGPLDGGLALDRVILTGGGNVLLGEWVKGVLGFPDESVQYATNKADEMQYANGDGAKAFFDEMEEKGLL